MLIVYSDPRRKKTLPVHLLCFIQVTPHRYIIRCEKTIWDDNWKKHGLSLEYILMHVALVSKRHPVVVKLEMLVISGGI